MNQIIIYLSFFVAGGIVGYFLFFYKFRQEKKKGSEDYLTKVYNYREFDSRINDFIKKYNQKIALALVDLDYFKRINDTYSYELGDKVLTELAELLSDQVRSSDLIFRFKNGDEFVIVFKQVNHAYLQEIGERIRKKIENKRFLLENEMAYLTASIGQTMIKEDDSKKKLLERLEIALKEAKSQRNKVFTM